MTTVEPRTRRTKDALKGMTLSLKLMVGAGLLLVLGGIAVQWWGRESGEAPLAVAVAENHPSTVVLVLGLPNDPNQQRPILDTLDRVETSLPVKLVLSGNEDRSSIAIDRIRSRPNTEILRIPADGPWIRDYLPWEAIEQSTGQRVLLKTDYLPIAPLRPNDDRAATRFARLTQTALVSVPIILDGGSMIIDGKGSGIVSTTVLTQNKFWGYSEREIREILHHFFGVQRCCFVEPLVGERTGHVDIFMSFINRDNLVVASIDAREDQVNHQLLEENCRLIRATLGSNFPIQRIPLVRGDSGELYSSANLIEAGNQVIVPVYTGGTNANTQALDVLGNLAAAREIIPIPSDAIAARGGALHCISRVYSSDVFEPSSRIPRSERSWTADGIIEGLATKRLRTMWELQISTTAIHELLLEVLERDRHAVDAAVRRDAAFLLRSMSQQKLPMATYLRFCRDSNFHVQWYCWLAIGDLGEEALPVIEAQINRNFPIRTTVFCIRLASVWSESIEAYLRRMLESPDTQVRAWVYEVLTTFAITRPSVLTYLRNAARREKDPTLIELCESLNILDTSNTAE